MLQLHKAVTMYNSDIPQINQSTPSLSMLVHKGLTGDKYPVRTRDMVFKYKMMGRT
jgi:hypothetical protein